VQPVPHGKHRNEMKPVNIVKESSRYLSPETYMGTMCGENYISSYFKTFSPYIYIYIYIYIYRV
jgi:hypothetical protein